MHNITCKHTNVRHKCEDDMAQTGCERNSWKATSKISASSVRNCRTIQKYKDFRKLREKLQDNTKLQRFQQALWYRVLQEENICSKLFLKKLKISLKMKAVCQNGSNITQNGKACTYDFQEECGWNNFLLSLWPLPTSGKKFCYRSTITTIEKNFLRQTFACLKAPKDKKHGVFQ